jgi:hypothetical protein
VALNVDDRQLSLWQERIILNRYFWQSLREHPVPIQEAALRAIGGRSMAIDVYVWLAYRLRALSGPMAVRWAALHAQFGSGFRQVRQFKVKFRESLQVALAVYPEAEVVPGRDGVTLHPSRPPVAETPRLSLRRQGRASLESGLPPSGADPPLGFDDVIGTPP